MAATAQLASIPSQLCCSHEGLQPSFLHFQVCDNPWQTEGRRNLVLFARVPEGPYRGDGPGQEGRRDSG